MSTTQYITDAATRHQVFLQRYGGGQSKDATALLYRVRRDITARLANEPTIFQKARLDGLLSEINAITTAGFKDIELQQIAAAQELAVAEARFSVGLFNKAATIDFVGPSAPSLIAAVMTSGMVAQTKAGVTIEEALQQFGAKKSKQIAQIIADGVVLGDTTQVISKKVGGVINTLQRRQLDTLVRTITNHTSSVARGQVYYANKDLLDGYQWVATLDNRTTMICGSRDGKVYQYGSGPMPPAHWGACVEDTLITTRRGKIPIQDVMVGDYALTHTGRWKRVNAVMAKPEKHKVVTLVDDLGSSVSLTMDHPVLTSVGYKEAGDIHPVDKLFNYGNKFAGFEGGCFSPPVEQTVLLNAHNMKTDVVERLIAYSISSLTAGVSASIKLNGHITNNKVCNVITNGYLRLKRHGVRFKEVTKKLLVKCKVIAESISQ